MALSNDLKVLTWIANKGLMYLLVNMPYIHAGTTEYAPEFDNNEYAKGDTIQVRRVNRRVGGEGAVINLDGVVEKTETLTVEKQFNDGLDFTTKEQSLFLTGDDGMEIYSDRYIRPSILRLVAQVETYLSGRAAQDLYYNIGTVGSSLASYGDIANINARMQNLSMPTMFEKKYLIVSPTQGATLKTGLSNLYNPAIHGPIDEDYKFPKIADFFMYESPTVSRHIAGAAADSITYPTLTVKTDVTSGNTITVTGFGGVVVGAFKKDDIISISGSKIISPTIYKNTGIDAQYVVQATVDSDAGGDAIITVNPEVIIDTTNPFYNLDAKLAATSPVTCVATHDVNTAFINGCLSFACPRMRKMDTPYSVTVQDTKFGTGISLRLSRAADIINDKNIWRWDLLVGARFWPEYGIRVIT